MPCPPGGQLITVIGWLGDSTEDLTGRQLAAIGQAGLIYARAEAAPRLASLAPGAEIHPYAKPFAASLEEIASREAEDPLVIASGDPSYFGIVHSLRRVAPAAKLSIIPGVSSLQLLCARLLRPSDGIATVSLVNRGREGALDEIATLVAGSCRIAILLPPSTPLGAIAERLEAASFSGSLALGTSLATASEQVEEPALARLSAMVTTGPAILLAEPGPAPNPPPASAIGAPSILDDAAIEHGGSNFTKLEVRLAAIARLRPDSLPRYARVLEVGSGTGTLGLTLLRLRPDLRLTQLEPDGERAGRGARNAARLGFDPEIRAERVQEHPASGYDAALVGGGGIPALAAAIERVGEPAPLVATYADPSRASTARELLGNLSLIQAASAVPLGAGWRLAPATPIFVAWR